MTSSYERFAVAAPVAALLLGAACGDGGSGTSPSVIAADAATDAHVDASADVDSPTSKQDAGAAPWNVTPTPTFSGQYSAVGDPSVLHAADGSYLMYHHCLDVERTPQGGEVCLATSADGTSWSIASTPESTALVQGRVLRGQAGTWHEAHETPFAYAKGGATSLFFIGYTGSTFLQGRAGIGRATSNDGRTFSTIGSAVLSPTPKSSDAFGITSPSIVERDDGRLVLFYTGWCVEPLDCPRGGAPYRLTLLAATSTDGVSWTKYPDAVVTDPNLAWTNGGISESEVVRGPDGRYFLFFSSVSGAVGSGSEFQRIGVAVAADPFGPFVFAPEAVVTPAMLGPWANGGVLAPTVLFEGNRVRMWFHAFERDATGKNIAARIGYAESKWPLGL